LKFSIIYTGFIELSGKVVVSDPVYDRSVWCMATDITVKPGTYLTYIVKKHDQKFGFKAAEIVAIHTDWVESEKEAWEPYDCCIGVDSGQCGIFDDSIYPANGISRGEFEDEDSFYGECCKLTLSDNQCGVLKSLKGVISSSGYGDGSYKLFCQYHGGERVALMVDFDLEKNNKIMQALANSQHDQDDPCAFFRDVDECICTDDDDPIVCFYERGIEPQEPSVRCPIYKAPFSKKVKPKPVISTDRRLEKLLPDGSVLFAESWDDPEHPSIRISLQKQDGTSEVICFAEFCTDKPEGKNLCICAYAHDNDEPAYYESYADPQPSSTNN
jgi:hypothetical protein